jgi:integrase
MFNTGARVQGMLNLRRRDLRLDAPCLVRLTGKGNKVRLCPLWPVKILCSAPMREIACQSQRNVSSPQRIVR